MFSISQKWRVEPVPFAAEGGKTTTLETAVDKTAREEPDKTRNVLVLLRVFGKNI